MPGVVRTWVVYAGGTKKNPTYTNLGDQTETCQIEYDPEKITYAQLLDVFWASHNPCSGSGTRQYMCAIFYHDKTQQELAEASLTKQAAKQKQKIVTQILPMTEAYLAEEYHQKYRVQNVPIFAKEFAAIYPKFADFNRSTAVMRVNGYLGGCGTVELLDKEIESYGLSKAAQEQLRAYVKRAQGR